MSDDRRAESPPLTEDQDGPLGEQGWHAGATFFAESGGRPANAGDAPGEDRSEVTADAASTDEAVHRPASEEDMAPLQDAGQGEPQSWPGRSFGSIPPPG
jgi:hypothetical protein